MQARSIQISTVINELELLCADPQWRFPNTDNGELGEQIYAWNVPRTTGEFLYNLLLDRKPKHILELGTSVGYSALWMGMAAVQYGGHIDTVEYFDSKIPVARDFIAQAGLGNVITVHHARILDFLTDMSVGYDFVFMDADKTNYKRYFELLRNRIATRCLIVADNAVNFRSRMQDFIDVCTHDPDVTVSLVNIDNGLFFVEFH